VAASGTSIGSSSEVNLSVSIKPTEKQKNTIEELDEIVENLDLKESSGYSDIVVEGTPDSMSNYSEEDFIAYGNVSGNSEVTWKSGLELYGDEQTIFSLGSSHGANNQHQVCVIINDTPEEFDTENNLVINPQDLELGAKHRAEGETE
jgi:hypothetical protein